MSGDPRGADDGDDERTRKQPTTRQPTRGQSSDDQPATGQPTTGQSPDNQPTTGQSSGGQKQPTTGQPTTGQTSSAGQTGSTGRGHSRGTGTHGTGGGTDLEPNVAGALAYVFAPLGGIVMLMLEGEDDFVRFHSIQSVLFGGLMLAVYVGIFVVFRVLGIVLDGIPLIGALFALIGLFVYPAVAFVGFAVWALLVYKAYDGERFSLPLFGSIASSA